MDEATRHVLDDGGRRRIIAALESAWPIDGVRIAWLFGSFPSGAPFRDVDVAVVLDDPLAWRVMARAARALWEACGKPDYEVDVVALDDATPAFRRDVVTRGRRLYERCSGDAASYWVRAVSEHIDFTSRCEALWREEHGST
jgi:hypothetical protein